MIDNKIKTLLTVVKEGIYQSRARAAPDAAGGEPPHPAFGKGIRDQNFQAG